MHLINKTITYSLENFNDTILVQNTETKNIFCILVEYANSMQIHRSIWKKNNSSKGSWEYYLNLEKLFSQNFEILKEEFDLTEIIKEIEEIRGKISKEREKNMDSLLDDPEIEKLLSWVKLPRP